MKIAIVGATGLVGRKIIEQLNDKENELICYASKQSVGKKICGHKVIALSCLNIKKVDFAIFSAGSEISKKYAQRFIKKGAIVIDNSSAFRREQNVPLIVPEINKEKALSSKLIANPNCSTIQIVLTLFYLSKIAKIKRVVVSTYQSASGAGEKGIFDLENKTTLKIPQILCDDLIPQIGNFLENGYSEEEDKIMFETKKILEKNIKICATAVRVPIHFCHGASVNVEFEDKIDLEEVYGTFEKADGIVVLDNPIANVYPLCQTAKQTSKVCVGRIRKDFSTENAINFWVVADNLYKGASTNAVQILNYLCKEKQKWKLEL